ncbi:MAG: SAP domain-containing protein [Candidatus Thermoplasmatota archaeon]|nr:SAP domain-containing protein [Candidatus Thermoplasmatota archaeon]
MGDEPTTTLTVAKLKALCVLNDVSASGKKAELLARLLEAGVDKETLGIEVFDEETSTFQPVADGDEDEPIMLSLEDEETMSTVPLPSETSTASDDEVLDAEVLEADLIDLAEETDRTAATSVPLPKTSASSTPLPKKTDDAKALTLLEMVRRPQAVAVLITLVLLGAGGWYYVNNQLEPFTADSLRYGDTMGYMITDGTFLASEEYVELVTDRLEDPPNYCRISLDFQGQSTASITNGGSMELSTQTSEDRLGAVKVRGGQGMSWLSVESVNDMSFDQFVVGGHRQIASKCADFPGDTTRGAAELTLKTWKELREQVVLATELDFSATLSDKAYDGTALSYGVGGLLGDLDEISPGLGMVIAPVELADFFGNAYITKDATGTSSGWEWRVTGSEKVGSTNMWKVTASHRDVRDFCLGYATMTMWLDADSPWAARQTVDVAISSDETSQSSCSAWQQRGIDAVLPEGELELHHTFERTTLTRGFKAIELGKTYDNRPQANDLNPDDDELEDWGVDGTHLPDNSTVRTHPLDQAMTCISEFSGVASGAVTALENDGYVWRAVDQQNGSATEWNISWVDSDTTAGWLHFSVSGDSGDQTCTFIAKGTFDESITHNRDSIPKALPLHDIEARLLDAQRYPDLTGPDALFTGGGLHDSTSMGYLVVVPGSGFGIDFSDLLDTSGATTVDVQRQWEENGNDRSFSLLVDGTDGRLIGWTSLSVEELDG